MPKASRVHGGIRPLIYANLMSKGVVKILLEFTKVRQAICHCAETSLYELDTSLLKHFSSLITSNIISMSSSWVGVQNLWAEARFLGVQRSTYRLSEQHTQALCKYLMKAEKSSTWKAKTGRTPGIHSDNNEASLWTDICMCVQLTTHSEKSFLISNSSEVSHLKHGK